MGTANYAYFIGQPHPEEIPKTAEEEFVCILNPKRWMKVRLDGETGPEYTSSLIIRLDQEPLITHNRLVRVYIEQQVAPRNQLMYGVEASTDCYFKMRKNLQSSPYPKEIRHVNAQRKFGYFMIKCPEGDDNKPQRKKLSRTIVFYLLTRWVALKKVSRAWLEMFNENKAKQDDYADCFLQTYVEECEFFGVKQPSWGALEKLWAYLDQDPDFSTDNRKRGRWPLTLTAEGERKYQSYLNRIQKAIDKQEKDKAAAEEKTKKAAEKESAKQQQQASKRKTSKKPSPPSTQQQTKLVKVTTSIDLTIEDPDELFDANSEDFEKVPRAKLKKITSVAKPAPHMTKTTLRFEVPKPTPAPAAVAVPKNNNNITKGPDQDTLGKSRQLQAKLVAAGNELRERRNEKREKKRKRLEEEQEEKEQMKKIKKSKNQKEKKKRKNNNKSSTDDMTGDEKEDVEDDDEELEQAKLESMKEYQKKHHSRLLPVSGDNEFILLDEQVPSVSKRPRIEDQFLVRKEMAAYARQDTERRKTLRLDLDLEEEQPSKTKTSPADGGGGEEEDEFYKLLEQS